MSLIERSLKVYGELLLEVASLGRYERSKGLLQQLSSQARLLSIIILQTSLLLSENVYTMLFLGLVSHFIAFLSKTPLIRLCRDAMMVSVPLALLIGLPSLVLNLSGGTIPTLDLSISLDRIEVLLAFLLRVYIATFNIVLFTAVTSISSLATALAFLRVPRPLIVLLMLTLINIFIAIKNLNNRMLGFKSRFQGESVVELWKAQLRTLALLLIDNEAYTHNLKLALTSRGFTINSYHIGSHVVKVYDLVFLAILIALTLLILLIGGRFVWSLL
jgi:energy-coupling factor transporter transmembrane protein EcfT